MSDPRNDSSRDAHAPDPVTPDGSPSARGPAVRLRLLGGLSAEGPGRAELAVGEKPLAVLAYLHVARPGGPRPRDSVVGLFWPELDGAAGRRGLRQAIHGLHSALGVEVVRSVGKHVIELIGGRVTSDVEAFRQARGAGRHEEAVSLFGGDFLWGTRLLNTGTELEDWVTAQRFELARAAAESAIRLAAGAAAAGDAMGAAAWGRRALRISSGDEEVLRQLLRECCGAGLKGVAVGLYERHADWLRRQAELEPHPATRALFADLMAG